jgi:transcriptional regulator with XRE-family HTH domain
MDEKLAVIKAKKVGLFIRQAREKTTETIEDVAKWLGIDAMDYAAIENGEASPSLPQLESLAYLFNTSFDCFLQGPSAEINNDPDFTQEINARLLGLRDHVIAALLKQNRELKGFSLEQLAESTTIDANTLVDYENGLAAIPLLDLEEIVANLGLTLNTFFAANGPFRHNTSQPTPDKASGEELPVELQQFIAKPVNRPYLELAMQLSQMEADKLRSIAASLLEITY